MFTPNMDLYKAWEDAEKIFDRGPYIAVFKKDKKTLIYIAESHGANLSFDMTDFCFSDKSPAAPEIAVVEFEREGREVFPALFQHNNLIYAAAVAAKRDLPVVYADLSSDDCLDLLRKKHPGRSFTD